MNFLPNLILLGAMLVQAQIQPPPKPSISSQDCPHIVVRNGVRQLEDCAGNITSLPPEKPDASSASNAAADAKGSDPAAAAKSTTELSRAETAYQIFSYAHAQKTFEWQYWSGKVIFWVVLLLVGVGVVFSSVQFYVGLLPSRIRSAETTGGKNDSSGSATGDQAATEFEASLHGVKLKSSVLGLLILAVSLVFFYLYLIYVYPITNVEDVTHPLPAATKKVSE